MGYLHIENLYKNQKILIAFRECYALEKIHGTSAHISFHAETGDMTFFSGGEKHERFVGLFDTDTLRGNFRALGRDHVVVYGEAYGGAQQGMKATYGEALRFVAFDVTIGDKWLDVPSAEKVVVGLGLEFVHYEKGPCLLSWIDEQRDADSVQAIRNGVGAGKKREGVVLRPLIEVTTNNDHRVIVKHKRDDYAERATPQKPVDPAKFQVLADAEKIAFEWVTDMRLTHVIDRLTVDGVPPGMERTRDVLAAMVEDVEREAAGEIVASKEARQAIFRRTGGLFKARVQNTFRETANP